MIPPRRGSFIKREWRVRHHLLDLLGTSLTSIGRIMTTRSALLYLQVPGTVNQVRGVRKVALVYLGCVGTDHDSVRGLPGSSPWGAHVGAAKVSARAAKVSIRSALGSSCGAAALAAISVGL